jgi:glycosyltransferase involved in cell wall biosynthesis
MLISVIIPAFNEEKLLKHTLGQIQYALKENRGQGFAWEIIVFDNNSTDRTAGVATEMGARVVFEPVNQIGRARNTGAGILFALHYLLSKQIVRWLGSKTLGYWYSGNR